MGFSVSFGQKIEEKTYSWKEICGRPGIYRPAHETDCLILIPDTSMCEVASPVFLSLDGRCEAAVKSYWEYKKFVVSREPVTICWIK